MPLAYVMAFKAGRFEMPLLLGLVVLDELNPVVRIYAWRMLLGRNGIINGALEALGIIDQPIDALLFNQYAVIVVLSTGWITYTVIPLYAAMKAIDGRLFQAAADLGAGWWTIAAADPAAAGCTRASSSRCCSSTSRCSPTSRRRRWSVARAATCSARRSTT